MKVHPVGNKIYLKMDTVEKVGDLDVSSKKTTREFAEVLAVGPDVKTVKRGDKILVKAWAVDCITHDKKEYFFVSENTEGICAVIT